MAGSVATPPRRYRDRRQAGTILADHVADQMPRGETDEPPVVLGLPRGGVPVAAPVAERLGAPLDVLTVRKIGTPHHEELAIGAVASGGLRVLNDELIAHLGLSPAVVEERTRLALKELEQREARLRGDRPPIPLAGRTVVVVDDGLATGATMRAAVTRAAQRRGGRGHRRRAGRRTGLVRRRRGARGLGGLPAAPAGVQRRRSVVRRLLGDHRRRGDRAARRGVAAEPVTPCRRAGGA